MITLSPCREIRYPRATVPCCLQVVAACLWNIQVDGSQGPLLVISRMIGQAAVSRAVLVAVDQIFFMGSKPNQSGNILPAMPVMATWDIRS